MEATATGWHEELWLWRREPQVEQKLWAARLGVPQAWQALKSCAGCWCFAAAARSFVSARPPAFCQGLPPEGFRLSAPWADGSEDCSMHQTCIGHGSVSGHQVTVSFEDGPPPPSHCCCVCSGSTYHIAQGSAPCSRGSTRLAESLAPSAVTSRTPMASGRSDSGCCCCCCTMSVLPHGPPDPSCEKKSGLNMVSCFCHVFVCTKCWKFA
mmetsp:Transcript_7858/g.16448  ORF Transcript_7858/g.16448 Transcript_7858/m.16448 type:complete len:210 (+) Transcript_7858:230-859(+)